MNVAAATSVPIPTRAQLAKLFPRANPMVVDEILGGHDQFLKAETTTVDRMAMFLTQFGHETGGLRDLTENLNYSAERLMTVWPGRFPTLDRAKPYAHNPEALANYAYGGRMGNIQPNDGWVFRGRGAGLTGRDAYRIVGELIDMPLEHQPDLAATPHGAFVSACGIWTWKTCNVTADRGDVAANTRRWNGGGIGLVQRREIFGLARVILRG